MGFGCGLELIDILKDIKDLLDEGGLLIFGNAFERLHLSQTSNIKIC